MADILLRGGRVIDPARNFDATLQRYLSNILAVALNIILVVAILGAIVLTGLGGATGTAVETLARASSMHTLATAFRFVFLACALVLSFGMAFLIAMEERALKGPVTPAANAPTAPATPIPAE